MKYKIAYSTKAVSDLDRIYQEVFKASRSYDITDRYIADLMDAIERMSDYPASGSPLCYKEIFTGFYFVVFKAYIAFYRIDETRILVDRILFGGSDYIKTLHLDQNND